MNFTRRFANVCLMLGLMAVNRAEAWDIPDNNTIKKILATRIDQQKRSVGIVVGVVDAKGRRRIISYGHLNQGDDRPLDGDTVFEIGSVTKVFTSLLLTKMVVDGQLKLDDPVAKYLPSSVHVPERKGRQIELIDLATHTSGLPQNQDNVHPVDPENPWVDYTVAKMYEFLSGYTLQRDIGTTFQYSNLGMSLLGEALSRRAHTDYETLAREKIFEPLHMSSTGINISGDAKSRFAVGHNIALGPVESWDVHNVPGAGALAGAGALRSTANDMMKFLAAELSSPPSSLKSAMNLQLSATRPTTVPGLSAGIGWFVTPAHARKNDAPIFWKDGTTGGYSSYIGLDPRTGEGVVVLSNSSAPEGVIDIGEFLLSGYPLANMQAPVAHHEMTLPNSQKLRFVGQFQSNQKISMIVTVEDGQLTASWTGQPAREFFPESSTQLFSKATDAQLSFDLPAEGNAKSVTLHVNGRQFVFVRIP